MSYPPIYIINLKRNPERKLYIQRQLDAFNLEYQFVNAIDKHDSLSKKYLATLAHQLNIDKYIFEQVQELLGDNLICSLSHIKVYNLMIENNIAQACILEDDGYLLPSFPEILAKSQELSWDILMLSNQSGVIRRLLMKIFINSKSQKKLRLFRMCYHALKFLYYMPINLRIMHLILSTISKYIILERNVITEDEQRHLELCVQACACMIGASPIWPRLRYKSVSNHRINQPYIPQAQEPYYPTSAMAYLLTRAAAIKWKQQSMSIMTKAIDKIPAQLYIRENLNLQIVTPPCVIANLNYLIYSPRAK